MFAGLTNVVTCTKNRLKMFDGFSRPTGGKCVFPQRKPTACITLPCATALACDIKPMTVAEFDRQSLEGVSGINNSHSKIIAFVVWLLVNGCQARWPSVIARRLRNLLRNRRRHVVDT